MVTVTKKQTSLALIAVVFATAMIVSTIASSADNSAFAGGNSHSKHSNGKIAKFHQSISQACQQDQNNPVTTAGAISPPILSGINVAACVNANLGGNAATSDQSNN
jgi:hypothetical protein